MTDRHHPLPVGYLQLDFSKTDTPALKRWLAQYEDFVRQCRAELDKRANPRLKLEIEIEME